MKIQNPNPVISWICRVSVIMFPERKCHATFLLHLSCTFVYKVHLERSHAAILNIAVFEADFITDVESS